MDCDIIMLQQIDKFQILKCIKHVDFQRKMVNPREVLSSILKMPLLYTYSHKH